MLPHRELRIGPFELLVVERELGLYRLYVGTDGGRLADCDSGNFKTLDEAVGAARNGIDPGPFLAFPYAPLRRDDALARAPHGFDKGEP